MAPSMDDSPDSDYFNDLTRQTSEKQQPEADDNEQRPSPQEDGNGQVPKPKRIACVLCRRRKLKCDGKKPACSTCTRLAHDCSYDEVRRKSGPKRGYVKALEARLAQVETLLKTQDEPIAANGTGNGQNGNGRTAKAGNGNGVRQASQQQQMLDDMMPDFGDFAIGGSNIDMLGHSEQSINQHDGPAQSAFPHSTLSATSGAGLGTTTEEPFPWEMIGLGLDEPLPPQDAIDELTQAYFDKIHPSAPMIHRPRYYAAMNLAPMMRPPVALRYAMWANAAAVTDKYESLQSHFYERARKYMQQDEMRGHGESMITIAHAQAWILIGMYEFKMMFFPRAWMSSGRACRMVQMMGLHRLDGTGLDVKQCLPPPKDWTEREERRRTFWMAFCMDRYSSIGTGWPMTIEERDIMTILPVDEDSYDLSRPQKTMTLAEALDPSGAPNLSSFGGVILMATLFGRNLTHLHRPGPDDKDNDLNGEFWKRHRAMENILLNTALALPDPLRLPYGLNDPNIVFLNMNIHTSAICLHQAAIFKADRNRMPARISAESKVRCITAAAEIASIMRTISHLDLSSMNPFISFCLYVAARVFVQYLKSRPKDGQVRTSLQFLLSAMHAIKRKNPLTESFLVQLDVDLEGAGLDDSRNLRAQMPKPGANANRSPGCPHEHLAMMDVNRKLRPTYGDSGLAVYTHPDREEIPHIQVMPKHVDPFGYAADGTSPSDTFVVGVADAPRYQIPTREQRTPGSMGSSGNYRSPANMVTEMDTSPDGSGGDNHTPNSQRSQPNGSSNTSNTGYSPADHQNQQQQSSKFQPQQNGTPSLNDNNTTTTTTNQQQQPFFDLSDPSNLSADFNMFPSTTTSQQSETGFVLPPNWNIHTNGNGIESTGLTPNFPSGLTPGPTGFTPGANGMGDLANMSEADWNAMLESMGDWDPQTTIGHEGNMLETMATARR